MNDVQEPPEWTAVEAANAIRDGRISSLHYAEALLDRCHDGVDLNAFITLDEDHVREAARTADAQQHGGQMRGPLHGVPIVLKDNIDTAALPTTGGTPSLHAHQPARDAVVATALFAAGAILLGKANLHELAFGITSNNATFGPVRNPYDPQLIPGGSSGGCGVAVAARMTTVGIGTDTGGSVRIPAALCGVYGFRPSAGRYSQDGILPISHTRDTAGPLTRSVQDCALVDSILTGGPVAVESVDLKGLRLGVPREYFYADLDADLAAVVEAELERLDKLGVVLVEVDVPGVGDHNTATGFPVALYEAPITQKAYLEGGTAGIDLPTMVQATSSPDVHGLMTGLLGDQAMPEQVYRDAIQIHRPALQAAFADYFDDNDLAGLLFPTTPLPARPIGDDETMELNGQQVPTFTTYIRNTDPGSNAGLPGLSLPVGLTSHGLPVGMEIDAPAGRDQHLLAVGLAYQQAMDPIPKPPPNM